MKHLFGLCFFWSYFDMILPAVPLKSIVFIGEKIVVKYNNCMYNCCIKNNHETFYYHYFFPCICNNMSFRVITEEDVNSDALFNSKFLSNYRRPPVKTSLGDIEYILETLARFEKMMVINLFG